MRRRRQSVKALKTAIERKVLLPQNSGNGVRTFCGRSVADLPCRTAHKEPTSDDCQAVSAAPPRSCLKAGKQAGRATHRAAGAGHGGLYRRITNTPPPPAPPPPTNLLSVLRSISRPFSREMSSRWSRRRVRPKEGR